MSPPLLTTHFATLAARYDLLLCDVWGVVHNGIAATQESCAALMRFRRDGGTVVLITNAPRPGDVVKEFIDNIQVPHGAST
jgi:ribonucleotide monophosphatase NagD (HAD superfamily)